MFLRVWDVKVDARWHTTIRKLKSILRRRWG